MTYVDGFVLVVPKKKVKEYEKIAKEGGEMWKRHGALEYFECIGDDLNPDMHGMKATTFPKISKMKKNETVWFSFIVYKSKTHRNQVNKKVVAEMKKHMEKHKDMQMPFDMKKFAYGGFKTVIEERT
jgi:uncharacterized protein YbaA (DUF1428 family)